MLLEFLHLVVDPRLLGLDRQAGDSVLLGVTRKLQVMRVILHRKTFEETIYMLGVLSNGRLLARVYVDGSCITLQLPVVELNAELLSVTTPSDTIVLNKKELLKVELIK